MTIRTRRSLRECLRGWRLLVLGCAAVGLFDLSAAARRGVQERLEDVVLHGAPAGVVLLREIGHRLDRVHADHALHAITHLLLLAHEEFQALLEIAADAP